MEDMDAIIKGCHDRGMKIFCDLGEHCDPRAALQTFMLTSVNYLRQ